MTGFPCSDFEYRCGKRLYRSSRPRASSAAERQTAAPMNSSCVMTSAFSPAFPENIHAKRENAKKIAKRPHRLLKNCLSIRRKAASAEARRNLGHSVFLQIFRTISENKLEKMPKDAIVKVFCAQNTAVLTIRLGKIHRTAAIIIWMDILSV